MIRRSYKGGHGMGFALLGMAFIAFALWARNAFRTEGKAKRLLQSDADHKLDSALEETFPGSDPVNSY